MPRISLATIAPLRRSRPRSRRAPSLLGVAGLVLAGALAAGAVGSDCAPLSSCSTGAEGCCPTPAAAAGACAAGACLEIASKGPCASAPAPAAAAPTDRHEPASAAGAAAGPVPFRSSAAALAAAAIPLPTALLPPPTGGLYTLHATLLI